MSPSVPTKESSCALKQQVHQHETENSDQENLLFRCQLHVCLLFEGPEGVMALPGLTSRPFVLRQAGACLWWTLLIVMGPLPPLTYPSGTGYPDETISVLVLSPAPSTQTPTLPTLQSKIFQTGSVKMPNSRLHYLGQAPLESINYLK